MSEPTTPEAGLEPAAVPAGNEVILVVEDDAMVRALAVRTLRPCGYTVLEAEDGAAALEIVNSAGTALDLIVSDFLFFPGQRERGPTMSFIRCDRGAEPADHHTLAMALG